MSPLFSLAGAKRPLIAPLHRLAFLDDLKVFLVVLVIYHHAGQPYGPTGGAWPVSHSEKWHWLGPFFHINASFFMGLFFLISGAFVFDSYARKGPRAFLQQRALRFGVPVLIFTLLFAPLMRHLFEGRPWIDCIWPLQWAHLWFLGHLLVYSLVYVVLRQRDPQGTRPSASKPFPGFLMICGYVAALTLASALVRIWFPIDRWVNLGVPTELAHLPQYVSLFVIGVMAGPRRWLERIPRTTARFWGALALLMVALRYTYSATLPDALMVDAPWVDLLWILWESCICAGACIGLIALFQRTCTRPSAWLEVASRYAFAVYIVHLPILVFVQMAMENTPLGPLSLTLITGSATVLLSYALSIAWGACVRWRRAHQSVASSQMA